MKVLLTIRNRIETFYGRFSRVMEFALRLVLSFLCLLAVRGNLGYNTLLSQMWFIIAFAVVCAFISVKALPVILGAYTAMQITSLSLGVGISVFILMAILYILFLRMGSGYGYALLLMILCSIIKIPLAVPLILAIAAPISSVVIVISGNIVYYMLHYISVNTAVFTGYAGNGEITIASAFVNGIFTYKEFIYSLLITVLVFLIVCIVKRINMNHANDMAAAVGAGAYIILTLITNVILSLLTFPKLRTIIIGTIAALVIALIAENILLPLDFTKAEHMEFEDEEYHYYVRAVPKVALDRENVHVTRINSRKTGTEERQDS